MSTQKNQPDQKKPKINVLCSVDDVHPEIGYGLLKNHDQFKYLQKLHDEFGLRFTLFTVPIWHGSVEWDIRKHRNWLAWIQKQNFYEIAAHGVYHKAKDPKHQGAELIGISNNELEKLIKESKTIFEQLKIPVRGWKTPGWLHPNTTYTYVKKVGYSWIADHFLGEEPITMSHGLIQIPYNCNTEELHIAHPKKTAILHSHISPREGNKNGWTKELYEETRKFLLKLQKKYTLNCMTFSEWVDTQ